jgi:GntR family histidine utilization transcriptional repressor
MTKKIPLYKEIKKYILERIENGQWQGASRVPSENELVKEFKVSRMTTNRALRELTDEGYLVRLAGVGTFVADLKAQSHPLEIHNIAKEIKDRGHKYSAKVLICTEIKAPAATATRMMIEEGEMIYHSLIIHMEQDLPIQVEDRFVNPKVAPVYVTQDFTETTPYEYLMGIAPLQKVEHVVAAIMPEEDIREFLSMSENEPCLLLKRRTWTKGNVASIAKLYHPGSRYELSGRFKP